MTRNSFLYETQKPYLKGPPPTDIKYILKRNNLNNVVMVMILFSFSFLKDKHKRAYVVYELFNS